MSPVGFVVDRFDTDDEKKVIYLYKGIVNIYDLETKTVTSTNQDFLEYVVSEVLSSP